MYCRCSPHKEVVAAILIARSAMAPLMPCALTAPDNGSSSAMRLFAAAEISRQRAALFAGKASIADQSHGRIRIGSRGASPSKPSSPRARLSISLRANFAIGHSAMTLIGHISTHLIPEPVRQPSKSWSLRGFAESLWDELIQMGLEFGVEALFVS